MNKLIYIQKRFVMLICLEWFYGVEFFNSKLWKKEFQKLFQEEFDGY